MTDASEGSQGHIVKPATSKLKGLSFVLKDILGVSDEDLHENHQLFVPKRFVFGPFELRGQGFALGSKKPYYRNNPGYLARFQLAVDNGELESVRQVVIPEHYVSLIMANGRQYLSSQAELLVLAERMYQCGDI